MRTININQQSLFRIETTNDEKILLLDQRTLHNK